LAATAANRAEIEVEEEQMEVWGRKGAGGKPRIARVAAARGGTG
jgi:hypothetical protein